ncbi:MAG: IS200/IS605 family element transposase accessory protein TnpB [Candidatus Heimdallarchaeota archaeon]|nr:IS200/IS605 family element transposase accessory protein TnpB [Candidatus Heimdallarchaeota archaeon]
MGAVPRAEVMEVKHHPVLSRLCHQTKNLYNRANYLLKHSKQQQGTIPSYYELDKQLKTESCYRLLPAHTAQHTLKLLSRNWKAYFYAKREWKNYPTKFFAPPRSPHYKPSNGETIAIISNQQAKIKNGWLVLPKKIPFTLKTRLKATDKIREVRIIPRGMGYTVEIIYHKHLPKQVLKNQKRKGALDLGLTNLVTFVDNIGSRPIIVKDEGKGVKSITQYYLKKISQLQEQYAQQQRVNLKQVNKLRYGPAYYRAKERWKRKVKDCFHKLSHFLVELWEKRGLHTIYIGYNPQWKQQVRLRKKTTQLFVMVPFAKLISLLQYKAEERGITIELIDESYTSKCSFLDNEPTTKQTNYAGQRIHRGMYRSAQGILINADVNASYNILLKSDPQALPSRSVGGVGGYVVYPLRVSYPAMKL